MAKLTHNDILKLAELSALTLSQAEANALLGDLQNIISYVDQLNEVALHAVGVTPKNENIFRPDTAQATNSSPLLAQAPERFENYFVVPKIVDSTKDAQ